MASNIVGVGRESKYRLILVSTGAEGVVERERPCPSRIKCPKDDTRDFIFILQMVRKGTRSVHRDPSVSSSKSYTICYPNQAIPLTTNRYTGISKTNDAR